MAESGLRLDEVAGLEVDDLHLKEMYVKVRGKGDKEGYVPIGPTTHKALSRYAAQPTPRRGPSSSASSGSRCAMSR
jgi:integrase/recombinase XerD